MLQQSDLHGIQKSNGVLLSQVRVAHKSTSGCQSLCVSVSTSCRSVTLPAFLTVVSNCATASFAEFWQSDRFQ